ncbi:MAG: hypothetical protein IPM82_04490 [Saprospiraceae bacterium]|nr:hypothetical protein [Saprospiraceae bacterium]
MSEVTKQIGARAAKMDFLLKKETGSEFLPDCVEGENVLNSNFPVTFGIANLTRLLLDYKALEKINTSGIFKIIDFQWIVIEF